MQTAKPTNARPLFRWSAFVALAIITFCFSLWATFWTGHFFQRTLGTPFDSLALNLLKGDVSVPDGAVLYENIRIQGRNVIYFQPFPALLRLPFLVLFPASFGLLSPLLMVCGGLFCATALLMIFSEANRRAGHAIGPVGVGFLTMVFSIGTPVLYLVAVPTIYQECILWASGFSLWALAIFYRSLNRGWNLTTLFLLALCIVGAALSRLTFALPLLGLAAAALFRVHHSGKGWTFLPWQWKSITVVVLPLVLVGVFQIWYNTARFGAPWKFFIWENYELDNPTIREKRELLGTFNPDRIPYSSSEYLGWRGYYIQPKFPYLTPWIPARTGRPDLYFGDEREAFIPFTMASPLPVILGLVGLVVLLRSRFTALAFCMFLFLGQAGMICSFYFMAFRYTAEFLPMLVVLSLAALECGVLTSLVWGRIFRIAVLVVGLLSIGTMGVATARVTMYQSGLPESYIAALKKTIGQGRTR